MIIRQKNIRNFIFHGLFPYFSQQINNEMILIICSFAIISKYKYLIVTNKYIYLFIFNNYTINLFIVIQGILKFDQQIERADRRHQEDENLP